MLCADLNNFLYFKRKMFCGSQQETPNSDSVDLAAKNVARRRSFLSLLTSRKPVEAFQRRERELGCEFESKDLSVL